MRTTLDIDDELQAKAVKLAGPTDRSALVREGLKAFIERGSARRLAALGGQPAGTESGAAAPSGGQALILIDTSVGRTTFDAATPVSPAC